MRSWAETMLCCCGADCGRLWRRVVLRKWLNVGAGSGDSDFSADEDEDEPDHQDKCCCEHNLNDEERRLGGLGAGTIGNFIIISLFFFWRIMHAKSCIFSCWQIEFFSIYFPIR